MSISFEFRDIRLERQNHFGTSMTFITLWWIRRPKRFLKSALKHGSLYNLQAGRVNMTEMRQERRGFLVLGVTWVPRTFKAEVRLIPDFSWQRSDFSMGGVGRTTHEDTETS